MKVRIRTWDDMQAEYGINYNGDIEIPRIFTKGMEKQLPSDRCIEVIPKGSNVYTWKTYGYSWTISEEMIDHTPVAHIWET